MALTAVATAMALALSDSTTPMLAPGWPFRREVMVRFSAPSSMRATSFRRTAAPSVVDLRTICSNSSLVCSLLRAVMVALSCCSPTAGRAPSWPADTCAFCALMALPMSDGMSAYFSSLPGSSHTRMA